MKSSGIRISWNESSEHDIFIFGLRNENFAEEVESIGTSGYADRGEGRGSEGGKGVV